MGFASRPGRPRAPNPAVLSMTDVFIACHPLNAPRAAALARALAPWGYAASWTARAYPNGRDKAAMDRVAAQAKAVVALWSREALSRPGGALADRAKIAAARGTLVAARLDAAPAPAGYDWLPATDLRGWSGGHRERRLKPLIAAIAAHAGPPQPVLGVLSLATAAHDPAPAEPEFARDRQPGPPAPEPGEAWALDISLWRHFRKVRSAAFGLADTAVLTACADGTARVWDAETGELLAQVDIGDCDALCAAFDPSGLRIAASDDAARAALWSLENPAEPIADYRGHEAAVGAVAFDPSGARVATASEDGSARLWAARSGAPQLRLQADGGAVNSVCFDPSGRWLATAHEDGGARLWDAQTGERALHIDAHDDWVRRVRFSPDGRRLITASDDGLARIWRARDGELIHDLAAHENWVLAAAFDAFGQRVVTASIDRTLCIWDAHSGLLLRRRQAHKDIVSDAAFSAAGDRIVTASWDGSAAVWRLTEQPDESDAAVFGAFGAAASEPAGRAEAAAPPEDARCTPDGFLPYRRDDPRRPAFLARRAPHGDKP